MILNYFFQPGWLLESSKIQKKLSRFIIVSNSKWNSDIILKIQQALINLLSFILILGLILNTPLLSLSLKLITLLLLIIYAPLLLLKIRSDRRKQLLQKEIPYVIDMLSMCIHSGMNIEQSFIYIGQKLENNIAREFQKLTRLTQLGTSFEQALIHLQKYIPIQEFKNLTSSIIQSKKLGTSLSHTLDIQSELIRTRRKQKAQHLSRTATIKITIPLVFFIFPALLIIYLAPGLLQLL